MISQLHGCSWSQHLALKRCEECEVILCSMWISSKKLCKRLSEEPNDSLERLYIICGKITISFMLVLWTCVLFTKHICEHVTCLIAVYMKTCVKLDLCIYLYTNLKFVPFTYYSLVMWRTNIKWTPSKDIPTGETKRTFMAVKWLEICLW